MFLNEDGVLPRGLTGFRRVGEPFDDMDDTPPVRLAEFKKLCHEVARPLGRTLVRFEGAEDQVTPSFHRAELANPRSPGGTVSLLCHRQHPWLALTRSYPAPLATLAFTDDPGLAGAVSAHTAFQLLSTEFLERPLDTELTRELSSAEREQIRYWKPRRVGELIFHWWD